MLEEPTLIKDESEITLPVVTRGKGTKSLPSFTDEQIWHFVGERGVYSDSPECLKFCFRDLVHRDGILMYRMKPREEYFFKLRRKSTTGNLFEAVMIHDPMEGFLTPETCMQDYERDYLFLTKTHSQKGKPHEILECWCSVPYERFSKYLNPETPMNDFCSEVASYLEELRPNKKAKSEDQGEFENRIL